jgi:TorA maturation chaperone TorD
VLYSAKLTCDTDTASVYLIKRCDFLRDHLYRWITEFANIIAENAQAYFPKDLANITDLFIMKDTEFLESKMIQSPSG